MDAMRGEVQVAPLQGDDLARTQPGKGAHREHGPPWSLRSELRERQVDRADLRGLEPRRLLWVPAGADALSLVAIEGGDRVRQRQRPRLLVVNAADDVMAVADRRRHE